MRTVLLCLLLIHNSGLVLAQVYHHKSRLTDGDTLPATTLGKFQNREGEQFIISERNERLYILDFWNIWCTACLKAMPKLDSLQKTFEGRVKIILVTQNSNEEVNRLFNRVNIKRPQLDFINGDTLLNTLFPHLGDPFLVWIDSAGKILYTTGGSIATEENISKVLSGTMPPFYKRAELVDSGQSILEDATGTLKSNLYFSSILVKGFHELSARISKTSTRNNEYLPKPTISLRNASILQFYTYLFSKKLYNSETAHNNRIHICIHDSADLIAPIGEAEMLAWRQNHLYSYEMTIPPEFAALKYEWMLQDLNRYFRYYGSIEEQKITCWILKRHNRPPEPRYMYEFEHLPQSSRLETGLEKISVEYLFKRMIIANQYKQSLPIINELNSTDSIYLNLNQDFTDFNSLRNSLSRAGIDLYKDNRKISVLVIRDKKSIQ